MYSYQQFTDADGKCYWVVYRNGQPVGRFRSESEAMAYMRGRANDQVD